MGIRREVEIRELHFGVMGKERSLIRLASEVRVSSKVRVKCFSQIHGNGIRLSTGARFGNGGCTERDEEKRER